jgi:hypothetical protein
VLQGNEGESQPKLDDTKVINLRGQDGSGYHITSQIREEETI